MLTHGPDALHEAFEAILRVGRGDAVDAEEEGERFVAEDTALELMMCLLVVFGSSHVSARDTCAFSEYLTETVRRASSAASPQALPRALGNIIPERFMRK